MQEKNIRHIVVGDIATNCWIYPLDREQSDGPCPCAVIDPGDEGGRIAAFLDQLNLFPAYILLTHGHFDHVAGIPALTEKYRSAVAIHAGDAEYLGPGSRSAHRRTFNAAGVNFSACREDMPPPGKTLAEGDTVGPFTVLHLPGHTPGSIALWDKKAGVLFSGDTLFRDGYGRTDLPGGNDILLLKSLKRLFALDGGTSVYPGHGPATSIAREAGYS